MSDTKQETIKAEDTNQTEELTDLELQDDATIKGGGWLMSPAGH